MRIIYPLVVLSLSFSVMSCSRSKDSSTEEVEISSTFDKDEVQKQLTKLFMAVNSADIETTLKFTHPYTIKLMGGEDQARTILKSTFESVDMEVESVNFPELPTYEEG